MPEDDPALLHDELAAINAADPEGESGHRVADALLAAAVRYRATDIHLDPTDAGVTVRLRCDGLLVEGAQMSWDDAPRLINQFKALAGIDPMTVFHPEDAHWRQEIAGSPVDLRLTVAPCLRGPKLAIRVLDRRQAELDLMQLGLSEEDRARVEDWIASASGMVLCVGPTGSGKTTTLYALLRELVADHRHIATIEDPPEYTLDGINQIAVDERHGIDFPSGLRALLRMDPDYLMLGEIRDADSARVLLEAAHSGRVALSSLHSRDAVDAITQLRHWGIQEHVIAGTASLIIAQRLVARLCHECRQATEPDEGQRRWLEARGREAPAGAYRRVGCEACGGSGYHGRRGLFELWAPRPNELASVRDGADESVLRRQLAQRGHRDLVDRGLELVAAGEIALEDLRRAAVPAAAAPRSTSDPSER